MEIVGHQGIFCQLFYEYCEYFLSAMK